MAANGGHEAACGPTMLQTSGLPVHRQARHYRRPVNQSIKEVLVVHAGLRSLLIVVRPGRLGRHLEAAFLVEGDGGVVGLIHLDAQPALLLVTAAAALLHKQSPGLLARALDGRGHEPEPESLAARLGPGVNACILVEQ